MSAYALIENGQVSTIADPLPEGWRNVSCLNLMSDAELKLLGWLPVTEVKPALTVYQRYGTPTLAIGADAVTRTWPVESKSQAEIDEIDRLAQLDAEQAQVKADAAIQAFVAKTPAQIEAYIDATVVDLASARTVLKQMGKMLLILAKRSL